MEVEENDWEIGAMVSSGGRIINPPTLLGRIPDDGIRYSRPSSIDVSLWLYFRGSSTTTDGHC